MQLPSMLTNGFPFWFVLERIWGTQIPIKSHAKFSNLVKRWESAQATVSMKHNMNIDVKIRLT
eukprot:360212-Chlamydomonas_euryale.AAC.1